ncbi:MAG: hypothetical protein WC003_14320, partial [Terrimicrobiaceae bacterium]
TILKLSGINWNGQGFPANGFPVRKGWFLLSDKTAESNSEKSLWSVFNRTYKFWFFQVIFGTSAREPYIQAERK